MPVASLTLWSCTNPDAINFSTAPIYAPAVTKTFAQWGIADGATGVKGGMKDKIKLTFPAQALNANSPFTYRSKVLIQLDGKNFFMGYVTDDPRKKSGTTDEMELTVMGPWWYLQKLVYQFSLPVLTGFDADNNPVFATQYFTHFTLNLFPVYTFAKTTPGAPAPSWTETITLFQSQAMIQKVLDFAISQGAWLGYDLANILNVPVHPKDVLNILCSDAITYQVQDYDVATWWDYSGAQPMFHCMQRKNLPTLTRSLVLPGGNFNPLQNIEGFTMHEITDPKPPFVQIAYEQTVSVDGVQGVEQAWDIWPLPPGWTPASIGPPPAPQNSMGAIITTVPLRAITETTKRKLIQTVAINLLDPLFWQVVKPVTNPALNSNAGNEYYKLTFSNPLRSSNLPNLIIRGGYLNQMGGQVAKDDLFVLASYQHRTTAGLPSSTVTAHKWHRKGTVTNLNFPNPTYFVYTNFSSTGDVVDNFEGMAQQIFEDLRPPNGLWEGTVPLLETNYSGEIEMGFALNLNNTLRDHAAMAALIQSISFTIRTGAIYYSLEIGPNKTISAQQIADRLRAKYYTYIQAFNFGTLPSASQPDDLPTDEETDALDESQAELSQHNVNSAADANGNITNTQIDATTGLTVQTLDPTNNPVTTAPSFNLNAADLTTNDALNA